MRQWIVEHVAQLILERPARKHNLASFAAYLERHGTALNTKIATATASQTNHKILRHIIGMERWGQQRLKTLLGAPFVRDEYDGYKPAKTSTWQELIDAFAATRHQTIELVHQLTAANISTDATVLHNEFGQLSARAWLRYLANHATLEAKRLK